MSELKFDPTHSAVLCLDCQSGIVSIYAGKNPDFLPNAAMVLDRSRQSGITVIYVKVGFRPNLPEINSRNTLLAAIKASPQHQQLFTGPIGEIHPAITPRYDDITITKRRINAFAGTDLNIILRAKEVDTLILFGISTSGAILSTLLDAFDQDYRLFVIKDCCADLDLDIHDCLIGKFFPQRATVLTAAELVAGLDQNS